MEGLQVIVDEAGRPAFAVIPWSKYERLTSGDAADEDLSDEALYGRAAAEHEESFPIAIVDRIVAGENATRVYRQHRGMTQKEVAEAAGTNPLYLSQIERGIRKGSVSTLSAIAKVLRVRLDDLIKPQRYQLADTSPVADRDLTRLHAWRGR